jgi:hypothetical protein
MDRIQPSTASLLAPFKPRGFGNLFSAKAIEYEYVPRFLLNRSGTNSLTGSYKQADLKMVAERDKGARSFLKVFKHQSFPF